VPPDVGADDRPTGDPPGRWRIQFWALQVLELGVAFLLVTQSVHVGRGGILVAGGAVLGLLGITADGPLGVFRVCGQRLHVVLVAGAALALGALALVPALRPDVEGLLVIGGAVIAVVFLATRTVTSPGRRGRRWRRTGRGSVIDATATVVPPSGSTAPPGPGAAADDADSALRRAGRTTGAAAAAGKRAVDEHRPQVEDQVKRTLRGAGRLAGKLAGPKPPSGPTA
jgi:hypothetical protein